MSEQTEARRLAGELEDESKSDPDDYRWKAAAELLRMEAEIAALRSSLTETLNFCEHFSNRWDGQTGAHPFDMVERAHAVLSGTAPAPECVDPMCACRGGPSVECHEGEREKELADLRSSMDFYKRRCDLLQKWQSQMRDPERIIVCDILANGLTMPEGGRYALEGTAPARVPLTDEQRKQVFRDAENSMVRNINLSWRNAVVEAVEAAHGITGDAA